MKIGVVLCTYNGLSRGFLEKAIESVINQTRKPAEIIVVDDGSTDDTALFVSINYPQIKLISKVNGGLPAARNTGIEATESTWIALLDDDDVWFPEKLELQEKILSLETLETRWKTICFSPLILLDENDITIGKSSSAFNLFRWPSILIQNEITGPSGVILSKLLWERIHGFDPNIKIDAGEDYNFWIRASKLGCRFVTLNSPAVYYRIHSNQATDISKRYLACIHTDQMLSEFYETLSPTKREQLAFIRILIICRAILRIVGFRKAAAYLRESKLRNYIRPQISYVRQLIWILIDSLVSVCGRHYRRIIFDKIYASILIAEENTTDFKKK
jgi:glycosyltransferase involved in cell wall biosynthesis